MGRVARVEVAWVVHPDAALAGRADVLVPDLSVAFPGMRSRAPALLCPAATCVLLPRKVAAAIDGVTPDDADDVAPDPLFFHLARNRPLRQLRGRQRMRVFGARWDRWVEVRVPIAWTTADQLAGVLLGAPFIQAVRCHLDPSGSSWVEALGESEDGAALDGGEG